MGAAGRRCGRSAHSRAGRTRKRAVPGKPAWDDIDNAMVLGHKHPTGPLRTTDIVGLDMRLGIAEYLHSTLGDRFAPPRILRGKVARGELGRKTGQGFFDWS